MPKKLTMIPWYQMSCQYSCFLNYLINDFCWFVQIRIQTWSVRCVCLIMSLRVFKSPSESGHLSYGIFHVPSSANGFLMVSLNTFLCAPYSCTPCDFPVSSRPVLSHTAATSHRALEMWLIRMEMCSVCNIHTGFWRLRIKEKNREYLTNNFLYDCMLKW